MPPSRRAFCPTCKTEVNVRSHVVTEEGGFLRVLLFLLVDPLTYFWPRGETTRERTVYWCAACDGPIELDKAEGRT